MTALGHSSWLSIGASLAASPAVGYQWQRQGYARFRELPE